MLASSTKSRAIVAGGIKMTFFYQSPIGKARFGETLLTLVENRAFGSGPASPLVLVQSRTGTYTPQVPICEARGRTGLVGHWYRFVWPLWSRFQARTGTNMPRF